MLFLNLSHYFLYVFISIYTCICVFKIAFYLFMPYQGAGKVVSANIDIDYIFSTFIIFSIKLLSYLMCIMCSLTACP